MKKWNIVKICLIPFMLLNLIGCSILESFEPDQTNHGIYLLVRGKKDKKYDDGIGLYGDGVYFEVERDKIIVAKLIHYNNANSKDLLARTIGVKESELKTGEAFFEGKNSQFNQYKEVIMKEILSNAENVKNVNINSKNLKSKKYNYKYKMFKFDKDIYGTNMAIGEILTVDMKKAVKYHEEEGMVNLMTYTGLEGGYVKSLNGYYLSKLISNDDFEYNNDETSFSYYKYNSYFGDEPFYKILSKDGVVSEELNEGYILYKITNRAYSFHFNASDKNLWYSVEK